MLQNMDISVNPESHHDEASWNDTYGKAKDVYAVDP